MRLLGLLFPGQGSQAVGMGRDLYEHSQAARTFLDRASEVCGLDFPALLFEENEQLNKSEFTQPAILANSFMAYLALRECAGDFDFALALGHSLGEFGALAVSGGLDLFDALSLVRLRGIFMQEACEGLGGEKEAGKKEAGMMVLLGLADELAEGICEDARGRGLAVYPANYNCEGQLVLAGIKADLAECEEAFKRAGAKRTMLLNMSVASHCPLLAPAAARLAAELGKYLLPSFSPVISNVSAQPYSSAAQALTLLPAQLSSPVLYKQSIAAAAGQVEVFVEFGSRVLSGLNKKIAPTPTHSLTTMAEVEELARLLRQR